LGCTASYSEVRLSTLHFPFQTATSRDPTSRTLRPPYIRRTHSVLLCHALAALPLIGPPIPKVGNIAVLGDPRVRPSTLHKFSGLVV
jgi:hypothetical protein